MLNINSKKILAVKFDRQKVTGILKANGLWDIEIASLSGKSQWTNWSTELLEGYIKDVADHSISQEWEVAR